LQDFNRCVLTRLGSTAMRIHALLNRGNIDLADAVRTTVESWNETRQWFQNMDNDPPPRVAHHLRTLVGIYRWLESRVHSFAVCAEPGPTSACCDSAGDEGEMRFELVDENGNPFSNRRITIKTPSGEKFHVTIDGEGKFKRKMPKGPYE